HKNEFHDAFVKSIHYPYTRKQLEEMSAKFLLSLFIDIQNKHGQSNIISLKQYSKCFLAAFNANVDIQWLPIGYHALKKPSKDKFCDATKYRLKLGINENEIIEPDNNEVEDDNENECEYKNNNDDIGQIEIDNNISNRLDAALRLGLVEIQHTISGRGTSNCINTPRYFFNNENIPFHIWNNKTWYIIAEAKVAFHKDVFQKVIERWTKEVHLIIPPIEYAEIINDIELENDNIDHNELHEESLTIKPVRTILR
ncbi:11399_t:CDS:2, partial [Dentiscutata heterogama]